MQTPLIPANETKRLKTLQQTLLLDSEPEERFDRLTKLTQQVLGGEVVLISLIDENRQWFKSKVGLDACETHRNLSFCGHAIHSKEVTVIANTKEDERFHDNPLVTGAPFIHFYAGAPLIIDGYAIGTLCIIDSKPKTFTAKDERILRGFADAIEQEIVDRLQEQAHQRLAESELMYRSVLEGTNIGTWQWNVQTGETVFNERWAEIVGYTLEELAPISIDTWMNLAHPDDLAESSRQLELHFAGKVPFYNVKCRMKHKLGYWVWVHDRGRIVSRSAAGEPLMMYGTHADITAEKNLKDQLIKLTSQLPGVVYQFQMWPDGRSCFPYASDNLFKVYGVTHEQVKDDAALVYENIVTEDLAMLAASIQESADTLNDWQHQYRVRKHDGAIRWVSGSAKPERMNDGSTLWHGYIEDITTIKEHYLELEAVNEALQLSQNRLLQASQTAAMGFWQASLTTGELWWSPVIYEIFGYEPTVAPSVALFKSSVHPDDIAAVEASEQKAVATGLHDVVHRIVRPDGSIRWVHELANMRAETKNNEQVLVGSVQDITERMQLQEMKDSFVATVSHELRTPVTGILGALQLLQAEKLGQVPNYMQKMLNVATQNAERLTRLINDLLDIDKLSCGQMPFTIKPLNVAEALQTVLDSMQSYAELHNSNIAIANINPLLWVNADELRLQQVLTNLVSNAIKFSPVQGMVTLNAEQKNSTVIFSVKDNGPGIPPAFKNRVFERFAQADTSSNRKSQGTGLGLAICQQLVQQMNGDIWFESEPHQGTTFCFSLPSAANEKSTV